MGEDGAPASERTLEAAWRTVAKRHAEIGDNEDSVAADVSAGRFAVADGASATARPGVWSKLLTSSFVCGDDPLSPDTLVSLRAEWSRLVCAPDLPWFAQEKLSQGSAATFVGLSLQDDQYQVSAVGDSCLFRISGDKLILAGPLNDWTRFSRFPELIWTVAGTEVGADQVWSEGGRFEPGEVFVLVTDAVAKHVLRAYAERQELLPICEHLGEQAAFEEFIERERANGLDNDDSTVCVVWT